MSGTAGPIEVSRANRAMGSLVTERLRILLEKRSIRLAVVGGLLIAASAYGLIFPASRMCGEAQCFDPNWVFIIPVAVAAIAAGLREGLSIALVSVALIGLFASAQTGGTSEQTAIATVLMQWFALFGLVAAVLGAFAEAHYAVQSSLRQLATTDPLTKVSNIERFYHELGQLQAARTRYAVMVLDLDELKALNDKHGHQAGSAAIQAVANVLRSVVRGTDTIARYGGDEFVVILREADRAGAQIVSNRVREMMLSERIPQAPGAILEISIGIAVAFEDGATPDELLATADKAMYEDKRAHKLLQELDAS